MRLALLSDIHGNAIALEAVLADIQTQAVDAMLCLGDTATLGPQPNEVLDRLRALHCPSILGNHEAALFEIEKAADYRIGSHLAATLQWCQHQLTPDNWAYLRTFQAPFTIDLGPTTTLLGYHGSPQSNIDSILPTTTAEELEALLAGRKATIMAGGHTHLQMLRQHQGVWVINPGSVGNAFRTPYVVGVSPTLLPWADYAIVTATGQSLSVDLRRVTFDIAALRVVVAHSDLPIREWWLEQYRPQHPN